MGKQINYKRLKQYDFYQKITSPIKATMMDDIKAFLFAIVLMAVTTWRTIIIVPTEYEWIVWAGMGVLLVMLLILVYHCVRQEYIPARKVLLCLNELTDEKLFDISYSLKGNDISFFAKDCFVAPRVFVYYKDIVSLKVTSKITRIHRRKEAQRFKSKYRFKYSIDITDRNNRKWQIKWEEAVNSILIVNRIFEELVMRCNDDAQIIAEFLEQDLLNEDAAQIRAVAEELLGVICSQDKDRLHDMMVDYILIKHYERGQAYVFDIFKTDIVSIKDFRSHAQVHKTYDAWAQFNVGRYVITTQDNEYFMFFEYTWIKEQRKITKLMVVPRGEMTEKEFFLMLSEADLQKGIYYPGIEEQSN